MLARTKLIQIPCLEDNSAWLLVRGDVAVVVDPPEAAPVLARLPAETRLAAVLSTHHHGDHVGGNVDLRAATGCEIVGNEADRDRLPGLTRAVGVGELVDVAGFRLRVLDVKAHTRAHVAYALDAVVDEVVRHGHGGVEEVVPRLAGRPALFVGDALFAAGCGRLFEGTPHDLERALRTLCVEDPRSLVCCAHEYTAANLRFARHALPDHDAIRARAEGLDDEMGAARSSLPSTLDVELLTNPFLLALQSERPVDDVGALRRAKDLFRG
jgi:hydroxyacylglutathione hydrolase